MNEYRYILEKNKKKSTCPGCGKAQKFVRYIDTATGNHLPEQYGRCDREVNCSYHLSPYKDGYAKMISEQERTGEKRDYLLSQYKPKPAEVRPPSLIDKELFKKSLSCYNENNLVKFLLTKFPPEEVSRLIDRYHIGTSKHWEGSTVFWQADITGNIKGGKIMQYSPATGKRVKVPYSHITWVHSALKLTDYNLQQCFFGLHLLNDENVSTPVAIVESEKTALIASMYLPGFIWLACGSLSNLNESKCKVLAGRNVYLFPDLNGFDKWSEKAKALNSITPFAVSDLLECNATIEEKEKGLDLADYLLQFNYTEFIQETPPQQDQKIQSDTLTLNVDSSPDFLERTNRAKDQLKPIAELWDVDQLENDLKNIDLPLHPVRLSKETVIEDAETFVKSHLSIIKFNNGSRTHKPYYDRLTRFVEVQKAEFI